MINLEKYYGSIDAYKLVEVIESLKDYKPEVIAYCKERISKMGLSEETLKNHARIAIKKRFYQYFTDGEYLTDAPIFIDSFYLNLKEVKLCFQESKGEYITYVTNATSNLPS